MRRFPLFSFVYCNTPVFLQFSVKCSIRNVVICFALIMVNFVLNYSPFFIVSLEKKDPFFDAAFLTYTLNYLFEFKY